MEKEDKKWLKVSYRAKSTREILWWECFMALENTVGQTEKSMMELGIIIWSKDKQNFTFLKLMNGLKQSGSTINKFCDLSYLFYLKFI